LICINRTIHRFIINLLVSFSIFKVYFLREITIPSRMVKCFMCSFRDNSRGHRVKIKRKEIADDNIEKIVNNMRIKDRASAILKSDGLVGIFIIASHCMCR